MENIRYAKLDASIEEVHEASKKAAIHEKIMSFPDQYNSKVGNNGVRLSGGEKQRIAIARAILKNPEIVLLDEATSAVDIETERFIQEAFNTLCQGRTTFIVAHRLSTIMGVDRILVVHDGTIIEDGSHGELLKLDGEYYNLWSKQILEAPRTKKSTVAKSPSTRQKPKPLRLRFVRRRHKLKSDPTKI